ncbi:MAG: hypothetical protein R3A52_28070 [Polyangiales bacterium]
MWTRASTLLGASGASCIDGRADTPVLGTPGGDAGELALSLSALEQELGRPLRAEWIASLFDRYVESFGRFYVHTDRHTLRRLGPRCAPTPRRGRAPRRRRRRAPRPGARPAARPSKTRSSTSSRAPSTWAAGTCA